MIRSIPRRTQTVPSKPKSGRKWTDVKQHRSYFDQIAKELNIQHTDDWYKVKLSQVADKGGLSLLKHYYDHSLIKALATVYPENSWIPWLHETGDYIILCYFYIEGVSKGFWDTVDNQRAFFDWYAQKNNFTSLDDWYKCSYHDGM